MRMMREYYQSAFAFAVGGVFSCRGADGERRSFQLLAFRQALALMLSFTKQKEYIAKMTVQRLET